MSLTTITPPLAKPHQAVCLGISFLLVFIVLLGIGGGAPDVLLVHTSGGTDDNPGVLTFRDGMNVYSSQFTLSRENQLFWLDLRLGTETLDIASLPMAIGVDDISVTVGVGEGAREGCSLSRAGQERGASRGEGGGEGGGGRGVDALRVVLFAVCRPLVLLFYI